MTTKRTEPKDEPQPLDPGAAASHLAATIQQASQGGSEDEPVERLVIRLPLNVIRACEALALKANRSRNWMAMQLLLAGLDGVLAALPADERDQVLLHSMIVDEEA